MPATVRRTQAVPAADKRDTILKAATRVFARNGYFQSQVADVAREAGVAAGTVYLYFRGKDDLLVSLFERTMRDVMAEANAELADAEGPEDRLRRLARLHFERMSRDRDLAVVFQVELRQSIKFMERFSSSYLREYIGLIRDTIAAGQSAGCFNKQVNATLAAKMLFGALDEMATNWVISRRRYSLVAQAEPVVDLFLNGVSQAPGSGLQASGTRSPKSEVRSPASSRALSGETK
jgi:TetR/AcrR family fatty acid metabolism transcriptional regulator